MKNENLLFYKQKSGFTLAETLITLVIIGVVAALTVPTLITRYQKEQTVVRLEKAYSALVQTTHLAILAHGPVSTWEVGTANNADATKEFLKTYVTPYLSLLKEPKTYSEVPNGVYERYYLDGVQDNYGTRFVRFYLNDGTSVTANISDNNDTTKCIDLNIDINGDKKPNKYGKDIFILRYYIKSSNAHSDGKFVPNGYGGGKAWTISSNNTWGCLKGKKGADCLSLIMYDNWQITADYPW